jgi:hypothetical protein
MGLEYVNRRGERYYLLQGTTKTGKPKYYVSRKPGGVPVEEMPPGYEFYESPERSIVHVRKVRPTRVLPAERTLLEDLIRQVAGTTHFRVEVEGDSLVVYAPGTDPAASVAVLSRIFGADFAAAEQADQWTARHATYLPMLRFTLAEEGKRSFAAERWCFRGSIDGWHYLTGGKPLQTQAAAYLPHLHQESFFDLF